MCRVRVLELRVGLWLMCGFLYEYIGGEIFPVSFDFQIMYLRIQNKFVSTFILLTF